MLCCLRGKGGTQPASAKEHELLVVRKYRLVIRTLRINPEFQHPTRAVESAWHLTVSLQFANVANIDQHRVLVPNEVYRFLDRQGLDLSFSGLAQGLVTYRNPLRHGSPRDGLSTSIAEWLRIPTPPSDRTAISIIIELRAIEAAKSSNHSHQNGDRCDGN